MFIKKLILLLMIVMISFNSFAYVETDLISATLGDEVTFGKYFIDDTGELDDLKWIVIDEEDDKIFLFSKNIIDCIIYPTLETYIENDFYNIAFDDMEKGRILLTQSKGSINEVYGTMIFGKSDRHVFLLTKEDVDKYFGDDTKVTYPFVLGVGTKYAYSKGLSKIRLNDTLDIYTSSYWIEGAGAEEDFRQVVSYSGKVLIDGYYNLRTDCGFRPAIWVKRY